MKKHLGIVIRILLSIVIIYAIFSNIDTGAFLKIIKEAKFGWVLVSWGMLLVFMVPISVLRWRLLLESHGIKVGFFRVFRYQLIGYFFNTFMLGGTGGDIAKAYYVAKDAHKKPEAVATILADRIIGVFSLFSIAFFALLFKWNDPVFRIPTLLVIGMCLFIVVFLLVFFNKRLMSYIPFSRRILDRIPFRETIMRAYNALHFYKDHKIYLVKALIYSYILQFTFILIHPIVAHAIGMESLNLMVYILMVPIAVTISALPISIQGWGVGEACYLKLFSLAGIEPTHSVALSIIIRVSYLVIGLIGGIVYIFQDSFKNRFAGSNDNNMEQKHDR